MPRGPRARSGGPPRGRAGNASHRRRGAPMRGSSSSLPMTRSRQPPVATLGWRQVRGWRLRRQSLHAGGLRHAMLQVASDLAGSTPAHVLGRAEPMGSGRRPRSARRRRGVGARRRRTSERWRRRGRCGGRSISSLRQSSRCGGRPSAPTAAFLGKLVFALGQNRGPCPLVGHIARQAARRIQDLGDEVAPGTWSTCSRARFASASTARRPGSRR